MSLPAGIAVPRYREPGDVATSPPPQAGRVYLHPGQLAVAGAPCTLTTILGSCVGVCLYDPVARVGGLNHFLLPRAPAGGGSPRYGDVAMRRLIDGLSRLGGEPARLTATVVGGACVLDAYRDTTPSLGGANVAAALEALAGAGIRVAAQHVGGHRGRRVLFTTQDGNVLVRTL